SFFSSSLMIIERRSAPIMILSLARSKSAMFTSRELLRAANSAASLTRLARSAPENPGVPRAITIGSTSAQTGQRHHDLPIETARTQQRRIEHVGAVGRGDHDDAFVAFEAIHFDQQL